MSGRLPSDVSLCVRLDRLLTEQRITNHLLSQLLAPIQALNNAVSSILPHILDFLSVWHKLGAHLLHTIDQQWQVSIRQTTHMYGDIITAAALLAAACWAGPTRIALTCRQRQSLANPRTSLLYQALRRVGLPSPTSALVSSGTSNWVLPWLAQPWSTGYARGSMPAAWISRWPCMVTRYGLFLPGCCLLAVWLWRCTLRLWQHQQSARPASATPTSPTVLAPLPFLGIAPAQLWASTRAAGHRLSVHQAAPSCLAPPPAHSNPAAAYATCPPLAADYPNIAAQARLNDLLRLGFTGLLMPAALCLPALALTSGSMPLWLLLRVAWLVLLHLHPDTSCPLPSRAPAPHSSDTATASAKQQLKVLATAQPTALAGPGCMAGRDYGGQQKARRRQLALAGVSPSPPANTPAVVFAAAASSLSAAPSHQLGSQRAAGARRSTRMPAQARSPASTRPAQPSQCAAA
ncbi:hypothetical protein V8C86DRAFT_3141352 [Haematococcus lacustris]